MTLMCIQHTGPLARVGSRHASSSRTHITNMALTSLPLNNRHLFDRIVSQRMMIAQGGAAGGWRIAQAAANIVRIKNQLKLSKGRRVLDKKKMIVGTQQIIRTPTLTQGQEHITPQGLKKERSKIQEVMSLLL